jgi:pimeloyl-ACP methyl ester carboxylesterase
MFRFEEKNIYFETHGSLLGEPLLLLNGIFMSSASWSPFVSALSRDHRLILMDFPDQGRSDKMQESYGQEFQVEAAVALLDHLEVESAHVAGISYGGEVALLMALTHPDRIRRLVLANTTSCTNPWLRDMGKAWEYAIKSHDGGQFFKTCIPPVYSPGFYARHHEWMSKREDMYGKVFTPEIYEGFLRLIKSAETFDVRKRLGEVAAPTLVISAEYDHVTPVAEQEYLVNHIGNAAHLLIKNAGHAAMYEKPQEFVSAVLGFLRVTEDIRII